MAILREILFCAAMFGALKHGFRSLTTLKLVVNVVGELYTEKNSCGIAQFPCDSTAFFFKCSMRFATDRPVGPIVAVNDSNDAPSWRLRPFYGFVNKKIIFPIFHPQNVKNCITPYGNFEAITGLL